MALQDSLHAGDTLKSIDVLGVITQQLCDQHDTRMYRYHSDGRAGLTTPLSSSSLMKRWHGLGVKSLE
jgi:hypothetical protein